MAFSRATKEHSLLLILNGNSARHNIAYTFRKALSNFKLLTAADTVEKIRKGIWEGIRMGICKGMRDKIYVEGRKMEMKT